MNNDYNELEDQIGNLGSEEQPQVPKKLKYKHDGSKQDLSAEEKASMEDFLARGRRKAAQEYETTVTPIGEGWIPVDREELGVRSQFYPEDWTFSIRPATVQAIKNWTAIDESRPDIVNNVFNDIIKSCVKIVSNSGNVSWQNINSWDRFWFIMKVRELTFVHGESKVEFTDTCSECDEELTFTLTSQSLFYEFPDEDLVEKYWNGTNWVIDPTEYDVDGEVITLYTPTVGKDAAIIEWATNKVRNGEKIERYETFIPYLTWMLNKPLKDAQLLDRQINKLYKEYKSWDVEMFTFMQDVIKNITINPSEKLRQKCPHCGEEVISNVQFPNGIKAIFNVATKAKKFGSR